MCPPMFHKLLYKLLTTLCVVSDSAPPINMPFLRLCQGLLSELSIISWVSAVEDRCPLSGVPLYISIRLLPSVLL